MSNTPTPPPAGDFVCPRCKGAAAKPHQECEQCNDSADRAYSHEKDFARYK